MKQGEAPADVDRDILAKIASGEKIGSLQGSSSKYRELATGILLQYADSEMAGGAGYAGVLSQAPSLNERVRLAAIMYEKLSLAQKTYQLVRETGINIDKYIASHCWESRLERNVFLGYRRASSDKRLNALMYPLQGWSDQAIFTFLMASMACLQLEDFSKSSLYPWSQLALSHLPIERTHKEFGLACIERLSHVESELGQMQLSIRYWYQKVLACFGSPHSEGNAQYLEFALKCSRNEEIAGRWENDLLSELSVFGIYPPRDASSSCSNT